MNLCTLKRRRTPEISIPFSSARALDAFFNIHGWYVVGDQYFVAVGVSAAVGRCDLEKCRR